MTPILLLLPIKTNWIEKMGHYQHSEKNESKLIYSQYIICAVHMCSGYSV